MAAGTNMATTSWVQDALEDIDAWVEDYGTFDHWLWKVVRKGALSKASAKYILRSEEEIIEAGDTPLGDNEIPANSHTHYKNWNNMIKNDDQDTSTVFHKTYCGLSKVMVNDSFQGQNYHDSGSYWNKCWETRWDEGFDKSWLLVWARIGKLMVDVLFTGEAEDPKHMNLRIFSLYLPIYFWILEAYDDHTRVKPLEGMLVGLSAIQGCGKTTLVTCLRAIFKAEGISCAYISCDDFYLTGSGLDDVAASNPTNPILQMRGNAGTHDLTFGRNILLSLKYACGKGDTVTLPFFDKSLRNGKGDRAPIESCPVVPKPAQIILLEGWMLGMAPVRSEIARSKSLEYPGIYQINENLRNYSLWHSLVDCWILIQAEETKWVYDWRLEQEQALRKVTKRPGMSDEEVRSFVDRFWPSYMMFSRNLWYKGPHCYDTTKPVLRFKVGKNRLPSQ